MIENRDFNRAVRGSDDQTLITLLSRTLSGGSPGVLLTEESSALHQAVGMNQARLE